MATAVFQTMVPGAQDSLHTLLVKAAYWLQVSVETMGGTGGTAMYMQMGAQAQDSHQVLAAKLAYWAQSVSGSATGAFFTFAAGAPPVDGSITTQGYWNTTNDQKWANTSWPVTATPTWEAM